MSGIRSVRGALVGGRNRAAVRLAAGVTAGAVIVIGAGLGTGVAAQPVGLDEIGVSTAIAAQAGVGASAAGSEGGAGKVVVGKALAVSTDAAGKALEKGLYVATNVAGNVSGQVKIPMGTSKPVDLNSFTDLETEGNSVVYNVSNSGGEVQTLIASGGQYRGDMPIELSVDLKVNGKPVDPNSATSITGNVELTYNFKNNTNQVQAVAYKDSKGRTRVKNMNVAVPFTTSYSGTFGKGWAQVQAPWANSGFSNGQQVTGGGTMMPSPLNGGNPDGQLKITAIAENASLPSSTISVTPHSINGTVTSTLGKVTAGGSKVDHLLADRALPLLIEVQGEIGKAAGTLSDLLEGKVDPVLNLLSKLRLNPAKANKLVADGGAEVAKLGDVLLAANSATEDVAARIAELASRITSGESQDAIQALIDGIDAADGVLDRVITDLPLIDGILQKAAAYLDKPVRVKALCPSGKPNCTVGDVLDSLYVDRLPPTCTTAADTNAFWGSGDNKSQMQAAIRWYLDPDAGNDPEIAAALTKLTDYLNQQGNGGSFPGCQAAAQGMSSTLDGLLPLLGQVGKGLDGLLPLLKEIRSDLGQSRAGLGNLLAKMPEINRALDNPCGARSVYDNLSGCGMVQALRLAVEANADGSEALNRDVLSVVEAIQPAIEQLFGIANTLGEAALPLEQQINQLPQLITQLAYGNLGEFVGDVAGLDELAQKLTNASSEAEETGKAIDVKFNEGQAFPYGSASGSDAQTMAVYEYRVASAKPAGASAGTAAGLALLLLLLGGGLSVWLGHRRKGAGG